MTTMVVTKCEICLQEMQRLFDDVNVGQEVISYPIGWECIICEVEVLDYDSN